MKNKYFLKFKSFLKQSDGSISMIYNFNLYRIFLLSLDIRSNFKSRKRVLKISK